MYTEPHGKAVIRLREFAFMARGGIKQPRNSLLVVLGIKDRSKEWAVTCSFVLKSSFTGYAVYEGDPSDKFTPVLALLFDHIYSSYLRHMKALSILFIWGMVVFHPEVTERQTKI